MKVKCSECKYQNCEMRDLIINTIKLKTRIILKKIINENCKEFKKV